MTKKTKLWETVIVMAKSLNYELKISQCRNCEKTIMTKSQTYELQSYNCNKTFMT